MCKMIRRFLSLTLAILLTATALFPTPATAAANGPDEIKQQIKRVYKKARSYFDRKSFDGYCGMFVSGQLYFLGISTSMIGGDGNDQYDTYCRMKYTSGGYRVKAYPARAYTLRSALDDITDNGTRDAYNILVGFEKTKSTLGKRYGHASVIHAILDGVVYFTESYDLRMDGKTYSEGAPISCSIDEYCRYFESTTTQFDGVIYFGLKTYTEKCKSYPASFSAVVMEDYALKSQPCEPAVDDSSEPVKEVTVGDQLTVTGLYQNSEGGYWYQVAGEQEAYIPADRVDVSKMFFNDVSISGVKGPTVLRQGKSFHVQGTIMAQINSIYSVRAQIYSVTDDKEELVMTATDLADSKSYKLDDSEISKKLTFRKLAGGTYRYELAAIVDNHYIENGQLQISWDTVRLWTSEFRVTEGPTACETVVFNACGGSTVVNQTVVQEGEAVGKLPAAHRTGYVFTGWHTAPAGGEKVDESYAPSGPLVLYAQWISLEDLRTMWQNSGQYRYFYSDGLSCMGCIEVDGTLYYFNSVDALGQSWNVWTGAGIMKN